MKEHFSGFMEDMEEINKQSPLLNKPLKEKKPQGTSDSRNEDKWEMTF